VFVLNAPIDELAITIYAALERPQLGPDDAATAYWTNSPYERARYVRAAEAVVILATRKTNRPLRARPHPKAY